MYFASVKLSIYLSEGFIKWCISFILPRITCLKAFCSGIVFIKHVDQKFESSQLVSQDALQKLEAQFIKEKEILEQELQDSLKLNQNLKAQLDAANQQTLKHAENTNQQLKVGIPNILFH